MKRPFVATRLIARPMLPVLFAALLSPACIYVDGDGPFGDGDFDEFSGELSHVAAEDMAIEEVEYDAEGVTHLEAAINRGNLLITADPDATTLVAVPALRDLDEDGVQWGAVIEDGTLKVAVNVAGGEGGLDIELRVPTTLSYEIAVREGAVDFDNAERGGEIAVQDGDVSVALAALDSELSIAVQRGDIEVTLADGVSAELTAATDGDITVSGLDFDGFEGSGAASGDLNGGGESISLASQDGDIAVRASE